jgi:hypothetical protein
LFNHIFSLVMHFDKVMFAHCSLAGANFLDHSDTFKQWPNQV